MTLTPAIFKFAVDIGDKWVPLIGGEVHTGEKMVAGGDIDIGAILTFVLLLERGSWRG